MITPFDPFLRVVSNMVTRFGGPAVFIDNSNAITNYNPTTGKATTLPVTYNVAVLAFDFLQKKDGDSTMTNSLIRSGDKQIYMQTQPDPITNVPVPRPTAHVDQLQWNGRTYEIITVKQLNPSGGNVVYTEMFIRGD